MVITCEKQPLNARDLPKKTSIHPFVIATHRELRVTVALESVPADLKAEAGLPPPDPPHKWPVHSGLQGKQAHKTQTTARVSLLH